MAKKIELQNNPAGGINLLIERDSGNPILILTGGYKYSLKFWKELKTNCENAISILEEEKKERELELKKYLDK